MPGTSAYGPQPCPLDEALHVNDALIVSFKVEARCSKGGGYGSGALQYAGEMVYAAAFAGPGRQRVLMINKEMSPNRVALSGLHSGLVPNDGGTPPLTEYGELHGELRIVEPNGNVSSAAGIATRHVPISTDGEAEIVLPPFAVAVLVLQ